MDVGDAGFATRSVRRSGYLRDELEPERQPFHLRAGDPDGQMDLTILRLIADRGPAAEWPHSKGSPMLEGPLN